MSYDYCFKIILIGEQNSGKSSLVQRLATDKFRDYIDSTIGVEFCSIRRSFNGKTIKYHLWDTAGQEAFAPVIKQYYKGVATGFLVIDSTDRNWKKNMEKWLKRYKMHKSDKSLPIILLLNKIDLPMKVTFEEFQKEGENHGLKSYQVSAKTGAYTSSLLRIMADYIMEKVNNDEEVPGVNRGINIRNMDQENTLSHEEQSLDCLGCIIQ